MRNRLWCCTCRMGDLVAHARGWVAEDAAFRFQSLYTWFGGAPTPIDLYLYRDSAQKRRLMGADRVDMAKPWLRQVNMVLPEYGASVLTHELAHVFAVQFAPAPFGVPMRFGVLPDALLIEGVAVAAEWPLRNGLDPHQWARAMRQLGLAPKLQLLMSPTGFFGQSSERAYTLVSSFCVGSPTSTDKSFATALSNFGFCPRHWSNAANTGRRVGR